VIDPARNAVLAIAGGIVLVAVFAAPIIIIQFRRFGRLSLPRLLGAVALAVYAVALVAYTLLPLPVDTARVCLPHVQLIPFHFVSDIARETAGQSPLRALTSSAVLQFVFNIVLFAPWGVIVRRFFSRGVLVATLSGLAISLLVESTQYTGIWGIYGCAFRLADVDDLIANTAGALVGALIAPLVLWWMPGESDLRPRRLEPRPVTVRRRWIGMIVDWGLVSLSGLVIGIVAVGVPRIMGAIVPTWVEALLTVLLPGVAVFLLPALLGSGATLGQRAVWLQPHWASSGPTLRRRLGRVSVALVWVTLMTVGALVPDSALSVASSIAVLVAAAEVIAVGASRGRGLGSLLVGVSFVDSRAAETEQPAQAT
jgi:glycopeptide antibiotics resistance protein